MKVEPTESAPHIHTLQMSEIVLDGKDSKRIAVQSAQVTTLTSHHVLQRIIGILVGRCDPGLKAPDIQVLILKRIALLSI